MLVYRIERTKYLSDVLSGRGAALSRGNRWNSLNTPMVYTSGSKSLAILEVLTRVDLFEDLPEDRLLVSIRIPETIEILEINPGKLPQSWNHFPSGPDTRILGDEFIRKMEMAVLKVPSSLVEGEFNFLINPLHQDVKKIEVVTAEPLHTDRWRR
ncbi:MAG: RES family NAD+ phosphorylase [Bacteroidetes bacterium]|nr:RES family NAD+ phosphorylase [Bacteroidota bacterium]